MSGRCDGSPIANFAEKAKERFGKFKAQETKKSTKAKKKPRK